MRYVALAVLVLALTVRPAAADTYATEIGPTCGPNPALPAPVPCPVPQPIRIVIR